MTAPLHPDASQHLPSFITAPGQTDVLMVIMALFLVAAVLGVGVVFLWLHSLPERIAHKSHKLQFQLVAVLGLLALFTHVHLFWVAALLLALIDVPDIGGSLGRIAGSAEKIAGIKPDQIGPPAPDKIAESKPAADAAAGPPPETIAATPRSAEPSMVPTTPKLASAGTRS